MDTSSDRFRNEPDRHPLRPGVLLVAEPYLNESCFFRSVILLIEHNDEGSMGLVLNKPSGLRLENVLSEPDIAPKLPLFRGGPVSNDRLFYLHTLGHLIPGSIPISDGICIDGDFDVLTAYLKSGNDVERNIRFFLGYAGWGPGQLEREIEETAWAVAGLQPDDLARCASGEAFWKTAVTRLDDRRRNWLIYPKLPYLN